MTKSIETMWKEGFVKEEQLIAPKINDLYNRKLSYYIKFPCFIFILGLHPFPGIIMLVFYSILVI